ncbi:uncharacterized protein LOC121380437 isoform X2 [Gigantopelta aegis]|uniref:uncharacterized protein LOC121380437 isoform X2 n=1 Tax=Gigantopelta aegis TaxID=1735272 RepID=UPI001B88E3FF|nr:uncharacterized protein LOC121380437 isoform X2 [Gigantopelta aegis]
MSEKSAKIQLLLILVVSRAVLGVRGQIINDYTGTIRIHFDTEDEEYWEHDSDSEIMSGISSLIFSDDRGERHTRIRREAFERSEQVDPHATDCVEKLQAIESAMEHKVVQMVVTKEIHEDAAFTCTFCGNPIRRSMLWFRLERIMWEGVYRINEIIPDMHDDPRLNRIYVETDHTLIIEKPTIDAGTYFCKDHTEPDHLLKRIMTPADIKRLLESRDKLRFLYHFDVIKPIDIPIKEVSRETPGKEPMEDETYPEHNFLLTTKWGDWSPCSTCGEIGTRKRHGTCAIKKMYKKLAAKPWFVEAVLSTYNSGVPCRSSVFTNHKDLSVDRPDEMESASCKIKCVTSFNTVQIMSAKGVKLEEEKKVFSGKVVEIKVKEGSPVKMKCPGVVLEDDVFWFNGTYPMKPSLFVNNSRVIIHFTNELEIKETFIQDTKLYTCYNKANLMGKFDVKIAVDPEKDVRLYLTYIWYTYPFNFFVFMVLMLIKHRHRRVAIDVSQKRLDALDSASESDSVATPEGKDTKTYFQEANTGLLSDEHGSLPSFYDDTLQEADRRSQLTASFSGSNWSRSPPRSVSVDSVYRK